MKVQNILSATDKMGNCYSTMDEIFGFRTNYNDTYLICSDGDCLIRFDNDGSIQACWMNCYSFRIPDFDLSISDFVRELRYRDILDESEVITDVYLEDEIDVELKVGG